MDNQVRHARSPEIGDLVRRIYDISIFPTQVGMVISRNDSGYFTVAWGSKVEDYWDAQDLDVINS